MTHNTSSGEQARGTRGGIVREEVRATLDPEAFLRWGSGSPRGFWARGSGWVAHVGEVASIEVSESVEGGGRFRQVEEEAFRLLRPASGGKGNPRLYGGFSFRADHSPSGFWEDFPSARFLLPEIELERTPKGTFLRIQARIDDMEDTDDLRLRMRARLEDVRAAVLEAQPSSRSPNGSSGAALAEPLSVAPGVARPGATGGSDPVELSSDAPWLCGHLETQREAWEATVVKALEAVRAGRVEKVVLARTLDVSPERPLDPVDVFMHLRRENTGAHVFFFEPVAGTPFLGAAPETVATLLEGTFKATAVAGSTPGGETPEERSYFARRLLQSGKDRVEHAYTVKEIMRCLTPLTEAISVDSEPHVLSLARIQHLETRVRARARPGESVLSLLAALHPTPAVCGLPRDEALDFLRGEEPFERGWYAGPVGWIDGEGNGVFVPALRSAVASGETWRLIAGAGIVPGSDPRLEWEETGMKFQPVLRALARSGRLG